MKHNKETVMKAHQYLYYVLNTPVLTNYEYDLFCHKYDMFGGGGSDRPQDYTEQEILIAKEFLL